MENLLHDISWVPPLRSDILSQIFNAFTFLGYTQFFLAFLPLGYWLGDKALFTRLAILVGIIGLSNSFLKDLFQDPRPPIEFALDPRVGDSYGFPSGHAQIAVGMWLWIAYELRRAWIWAICIFIAAGVCASRIYLGVHDVEDVLGGMLIGLATIIIFQALLSQQFDALHRLSPIVHALAFIAAGFLLTQVWPKQPSPSSASGLSAMVATWWLGHNVMSRWTGSDRHKNLLAALLASIAGVAALFMTFQFVGKSLSATGLSPELALMIQLSYLSLFVTILIPALLKLLGISSARE